MCVFAPGAQPPLYVSVWLALDDCDARNGCLEVLQQYCLGCSQLNTLRAYLTSAYRNYAPIRQHVRGPLGSSRSDVASYVLYCIYVDLCDWSMLTTRARVRQWACNRWCSQRGYTPARWILHCPLRRLIEIRNLANYGATTHTLVCLSLFSPTDLSASLEPGESAGSKR